MGTRSAPGSTTWPRTPWVALLAAACAGDPSPVATGAFAATPGDTASVTLELRIDGYAADLVDVYPILVAADGTMILGQRDDHLLRYFAPDGTSLGSVGGRGEGPGEFGDISAIGWMGDSLTVYDSELRRFTVLGPDGGFGRVVRADDSSFDRVPGGSTTVTSGLDMRLRIDGTVVSFQHARTMTGCSGTSTVDVVFVRTEPAGPLIRELFRADASQPGVCFRVGNHTSSAPFPYPNTPRAHLSPDGERFAIAQATLEGPGAATFAVTVVTAEGDTAFSRRYPFDPEPITERFADSLLEARAQSMAETSPRLASAYRREATLPPLRPPLLGLTHGSDGTVFVRLRTPLEGRLYLVLDAAGEPVGYMRMPRVSGVLAVDRDHVWALERDELGMNSVLRYRIGW